MDKEKKMLPPLLGAIAYLKGHSLYGASVSKAFHPRRVAPLMACALLLCGMVPGVQLEGTTLAQGPLYDLEIEQCIREALDKPEVVFPVKGHLAMRPDASFVDLVSTSQPPFHVLLLSRSYFWLHGSVSVGTVQPLLRLSCAVARG
jgi:hypothetical protein